MKEYYVYILRCSDNSYYIGVTNNLEERILQHQRGDDRLCYTYSRREVELVWFETFREINQAIEREKQIKGWSRAKKDALIQNTYEKLPDLAKNSYAKRVDGITLQLEKERGAILKDSVILSPSKDDRVKKTKNPRATLRRAQSDTLPLP